MKFSTKLDSDELYCVAKTVAYCLSVSLFVHFSFSPMEISVSDFSGPNGASVFKFCVNLQEGKVYCVNENYEAYSHCGFFFNFSFFFFCHSYVIQMDNFFLSKDFSAPTLVKILKGSVSIRPFSWLKPIFFKLCILKLICIDYLMMQYQLVWFTDFCCMHDVNGWGYSTPLKV